jgi:hypothetical protein
MHGLAERRWFRKRGSMCLRNVSEFLPDYGVIFRRISLMEGLFAYLAFSHFPPISKNYGALLSNVLFSFLVFGCFWNNVMSVLRLLIELITKLLTHSICMTSYKVIRDINRIFVFETAVARLFSLFLLWWRLWVCTVICLFSFYG